MGWRTWIIVLLAGLIIWFVAAPPLQQERSVGPYLGAPGPKILGGTPPVASIYVEVKAWAAIIGQIMSGLAGAGLVLKTCKEVWAKIVRRKND